VIQKNHNVTQRKKDQRKERVLHTRVSEKLDSELREKAAGLGVSVSNLVRNILLNTVEMVEDIVADGSSIARAASKNKAAPSDPGEILGWQTLTLNLNAICEECNAMLAKGSIAAMAVSTAENAPVFRCPSCLPKPEATEEEA
jgi:hypothetical protein